MVIPPLSGSDDRRNDATYPRPSHALATPAPMQPGSSP